MTPASTAAGVTETHTATVFFVGDRAYKLKKPVALGFLDFTTREAREAMCHREVELNRRVAPDVYLGVADVIGPDGELCDHVVVMRRMPDDRRLATCLARGDDVASELWKVAHVVAALEAGSARSAEMDAVGSAAAVRSHWDDSFEQLRPFVGPVLDPDRCRRVEHLVHRYIDGRGALFDTRIAEGRIVDGHGDLLADDIFLLPDGPRVLDCIEFDDRLRWGDGLSDASFLAMDLERRGHPHLARRFLKWYGELADDRWPSSLADHYVAYRAHVRAKVACLRHSQGDASAAAEAAELLALTASRLEAGRVKLVLIGGLPGTGKSTHAQRLSDRNEAVLLRSDEVRKQRAGLAPLDRAGAPYGSGLYAIDVSDAVYATLLEDAARLLSLGESVILDASWKRAGWRARARDVAAATQSAVVELRCVAPMDVARRRLAARNVAGLDPSDATAEIAGEMAGDFDEWAEATVIDTDAPLEVASDIAATALRASP